MHRDQLQPVAGQNAAQRRGGQNVGCRHGESHAQNNTYDHTHNEHCPDVGIDNAGQHRDFDPQPGHPNAADHDARPDTGRADGQHPTAAGLHGF